MSQYLLTDEPWIPCELPDGRPVELGLRDVFQRAHELRALSDASPLVTAALHRLLLAIVHRCFGPATVDDWIALFQGGEFDSSVTDGYFDTWQHRFDLFDDERPFYQGRSLPYTVRPAIKLLAEHSNYGAPLQLFQHRPPVDDGSISAPVAARGLVAAQAFSPQGTVSRGKGERPSAAAAPLNSAGVAVLQGTSLFETLLLNAPRYSPSASQPIPSNPADCPAWERDDNIAPKKRTPDGWLDLLTWQSRHIELAAGGQHGVQGFTLAGGWDLDGDVRDPMTAWTRSAKGGWMPIRIDPERASWRDAHVLFVAGDGDQSTHKRPMACDFLALDRLRGVVPRERRYKIEVLGLSGKQARIVLVRGESLSFSPRLLAEPDLGEDVRDAIAYSEAAAAALRTALRRAARYALSPGKREPAASDISAAVDASGGVREYWARAEPPFHAFLHALSGGDGAALDAFAAELRRLALASLDLGTTQFGTAARALKARSVAELSLRRELAAIFPKEAA